MTLRSLRRTMNRKTALRTSAVALAAAGASALLAGCTGDTSLSSTLGGNSITALLLMGSLMGTLAGCGMAGGAGNSRGIITAPPNAAATELLFLDGLAAPAPGLLGAAVNNGQVGTPLPAFRVAAVDANGQVVTSFNSPITIALGAGSPAGAQLQGTLTVNAVGGIATFTNVILTSPNKSFTLAATSASDPNLTAATSNTFDVAPVAASFQTRLDFPQGKTTSQAPAWETANHSRITAAQLTSSGHTDLVVTNNSDDSISVMLGNGDGTYQTPVTYSVLNNGQPHPKPQQVAVADLNGDKLPDLVVGNQENSNVSIFIGNGDGTFKAPTSLGAWAKPSEVVACDLGTGTQSLLMAGSTDYAQSSLYQVIVAVGNGDGTFKPNKFAYGAAAQVQSIAADDFKGNGHKDLVVACAGHLTYVPGNGDGTFGSGVDLATPTKPTSVTTFRARPSDPVSIAYVDKTTNQAFVLKGNGDGTFAAAAPYTTPTGPVRIKTGDVNGDGVADLAVVTDSGSNSGSMALLLGAGDGTFQAATSTPLAGPGRDLAVADVDGDGKADVTTISWAADPNTTPNLTTVGPRPTLANVVGQFLTSAAASNQAQVVAPAGNDAITQSIGGDVDGDGTPDVIMANLTQRRIDVMIANHDGSFKAVQSTDLGFKPTRVAVSDLNKDGKLDLVVGNADDGNVTVLLGNGNGSFQAPSTLKTAQFTHADSVTVGDLNGDGNPDIITGTLYGPPTGHAVNVMLGNGDGTFKAATALGNGYARNVITADLDGDGKLDLIWAIQRESGFLDSSTGLSTVPNLCVALGNGDGTFQAQTNYNVAVDPFGLAAADLNGDSHVDVVTTNELTGQVSVLLNTGTGGKLGSASLVNVGFVPHSVVVQDVNNDGKVDLVVGSSGSSSVSVLLGNGDGTYKTAKGLGGPNQLDDIIVTDLNADGKLDAIGIGSNGSVTRFSHL